LITFDYSGDDYQEISFDSTMDWMINTYSALAVSDAYLYVRNVNNRSTGVK